MPAIATIATVSGGVIAYIFQKRADIKTELIKNRREVYKSLLEKFHERISISTLHPNDPKVKELDLELNAITITALLYSSDNVAREIGPFRRMLANDIKVEGIVKLERFSKMVLAMRKDCFQKSIITEEEMSQLLPLIGNKIEMTAK
jgi:hypothetical protein